MKHAEVMKDFSDKFTKNLSDEQWKEAEAIEAEIGQILKEGFTEDTALMFVCAVMAIRKMQPASTVEGIYEAALKVGLCEVVAQLPGSEGAKSKRRTGSKLR